MALSKMKNPNNFFITEQLENHQFPWSKFLAWANLITGFFILIYLIFSFKPGSSAFIELPVILGIFFICANSTVMILRHNARSEKADILKNQSSIGMVDEDLNQLIKGIAHDFNNILTTLTGILSLSLIDIQENPDPAFFPILEENLDIALKAASKASGLTEQLLKFAKGGQPIKENASLSEIVEDSAKFILSGSSVAADFDIPPNIPPIKVDPSQISQVIQNLTLNAKQAMNNQGKIKVKIEYFKKLQNFFQKYQDHRLIWANNHVNKAVWQNEPVISISIEDKGPGIPREIQDKLFHQNITTKNRGNGLGLASCYHIIRKHGGDIAFSTNPGEGTTFFVVLPRTYQ